MRRAAGFEHVLVLLTISFSVVIALIFIVSAAIDLYIKFRDRGR